jgi:hypothetical protein
MSDSDSDIFNEWSSGVSLANSDFFEEIPGDMEHPADFTVSRDQIPDNPVNPVDPPTHFQETTVSTEIPVSAENPENGNDEPEVIDLKDGGTITIEKTNKGWKVILDSGIPGVPQENFYGNTFRQLVANLAKGKLEASKAIKKLKKEKLLGGDETPIPMQEHSNQKILTSNILTADDMYAIKNKMENPVEAFDEYFLKRFGVNPEEFKEALNSAKGAERIANALKIQAEINEINGDFIRENPDYAENYTGEVWQENARILLARMIKTYLHKTVGKNTTNTDIDELTADLFLKGFYTAENLEKAKGELIEADCFVRPVQNQPVPTTKPQPVAKRPSESTAQRIAANPEPVALGLPVRTSTPVAEPASRALTDTDLQSMSMEQLRKIAQAQLQQMKK